MIRLLNLDRRFRTKAGEAVVLKNVTLSIAEGEFLSIVGPSGSGKSSLLNVLGLLDPAWTGEYWFGDHAVHRLSPKQRQAFARDAVGFIFQQYHLLDDLSVAENLDLPLSYRDIDARERKHRVEEMLERFDLRAKRDYFPNQLSGGQQQLVAVARALIGRPKLLLADEPTGALHSSQGRMIMDVLKQLNANGSTIVQVTHNPDFVDYGTRTLEMRDGALI